MDLDNIECLLLDLDGTLLGIEDSVFEGIYTKEITKYFSDKLEPEFFVNALWKGTEEMMKHADEDEYVLETFFNTFSELTGMEREDIFQRFDEFYRNEFGKLETVVEPIPQSRKLIDKAKSKDIKLILATNPVFPEIATRRRCKWTNIEFDEFLYVSHAENSHYCKPHPKYYKNLLEIANVAPENALMIGNDYLFDMAASKVGIKTWMVSNGKYKGNHEYENKFHITYEGSLDRLINEI